MTTPSARRTPKWILIGGLVLLLFLILAVVSWMLTRFYGPVLVQRMESALERELGRPVRVGAVTLRFWRGRIGVEDLAIAAGDTWEEGTTLEIERAEAALGWSSIWRREIVVSRILVQGMDVHWVQTGTSPSARPSPPLIPHKADLGPVTVSFEALEIERGRIKYEDRTSGLSLSTEGFRARTRPKRGIWETLLGADTIRIALPGMNQELEELQVKLSLGPEDLSIAELSFRWEGRELRASGRVSDIWSEPFLAVESNGRIALVSLSSHVGLDVPIAGELDFRASLNGRMSNPDVAARLFVPALSIGNVTAEEIEGRVVWSGRVLRLDHLGAELWDGKLRGSGSIDPARLSESRVKLALKGISIPRALKESGIDIDIGGKATLEAEILGHPLRPFESTSRFHVSATEVSLPHRLSLPGTIGFSASAELKEGRFEVEKAQGKLPGLDFTFDGSIDHSGPMDLQAKISADLASLFQGQPGAGKADLTAKVTRNWRNPEIRGRLLGDGIEWEGRGLGGFDVPFRYSGKTLAIDAARLFRGGSLLAVSGSLDWRDTPSLDLADILEKTRFQAAVEADSARLEDLPRFAFLEWTGKGKFSGSGSIEGTLSSWRGKARLTSGLLELAGMKARSIEAELSLGSDRIEVDGLRGRLLDLPVHARGAWNWSGEGHADIEIGPGAFSGKEIVPPRFPLEGDLRATLEIRLAGGKFLAEAEGEFARASAAGFTLGKGDISIRLIDDDLNAEVAFPEAGLSGTARGTLSGGGVIGAEVRLVDLRLSEIPEEKVPFSLARLDGRLSALATAEIPVSKPAEIEASVKLDPVEVSLAKMRLKNEGPVLLTWKGDTLRLEQLKIAGPDGTIEVSGILSDGSAMDIKLSGSFPLQLVAALRPEIRQAAGVLHLQARLSGPLDSPTATGDGRIEGGQLLLRDYPELFREVNARFTVSPQGFHLGEASAAVGGGSARAEGELSRDDGNIGAYRFSLTLRSLPSEVVSGLETVWDTDLELLGGPTNSLLRGEARLVRGTYTRELSLLSVLLSSSDGQGAGGEFSLPIQITVRLDDNLIVRSAQARFRVGGIVSLEGTTDSPVLFGTLKTDQGHVTIRRNRFRLVSGSARFIDPRSPQPFLNVLAEGRIQEVDVRIHISGFPDDLTIRLSSTPPMPEEDLLSLISFGVTREALAESPAGVLAGEATHFLVQDLLGLRSGPSFFDVLELDTTTDGGRRITAGKRITEKTMIIYSQGLTDAQERQLRVEYQLFGPLLLAGEQNFQGGFGGDLVLRLRFR